MSSKDAHLYGLPRPKKARTGRDISASTLAFTSQLSTLISASKASASAPSSRTRAAAAGRSRPKKDDIFSKHNRNAKKRALADSLQTDAAHDDTPRGQQHGTRSEALDDATWKRARRRMEEKARLYAAMKRGDVEDVDERYAVDFDRKWAEAEDAGAGHGEDTSSGEDDDDDSEPEETVEYVDEFGRSRRGTKAERARVQRIMRAREAGVDEPDRFTARPSAPEVVIRGDTVQFAAFNPDETIAQQMADLAKKRDRSLTPPPQTHFDGRQEIRQKGQGFFQFSADEEERMRQMENLENERLQTQQRRKENDDRKEKRRREVEERRLAILKKRSFARADRFLESLAAELNGEPAATQRPKNPEQVEDEDVGAEVSNPATELERKLAQIDDGE